MLATPDFEGGTVALDLAEHGVRIASFLLPAVPRSHLEHGAAASNFPAHAFAGQENRRVRYAIGRVAGESAADPETVSGWTPTFRDSEVVVYRSNRPGEYAWLVAPTGALDPLPLDGATADSFRLRTTSDGRSAVAVAADYYLGWKVAVDGRDANDAIDVAGYVGTATLPGTHEYVFWYEDPVLFPAIVLACMVWITLAALAVDALRRNLLGLRSLP